MCVNIPGYDLIVFNKWLIRFVCNCNVERYTVFIKDNYAPKAFLVYMCYDYDIYLI